MAYGQAWPVFQTDDQTSIATTGSVTSVSGSTVVVFVGSNGHTFIAGDITDSKGNTYTLFAAGNISGPVNGFKVAAYYAVNIIGGASHTISCANPDGSLILLAAELTSMQAASFDQSTSGTGTSTALASGNVTTTDTDTLVGMGMSEIGVTGTWTAGSGFTSRAQGTNIFQNMILETKDAATAGTNSAAATHTQANGWVMQIGAFKEASGGGGGGTPALDESAYSILEPQTNPLTISQW